MIRVVRFAKTKNVWTLRKRTAALEADYLAALQAAAGWRFFAGQLAVDYETAGGEQGTLLFNLLDRADTGIWSQ